MPPSTKKWVAGIIASGIVTIAGPVLGLLGTAIGLGQSFRAVGGQDVDPSSKARALSEGINWSMGSTVIGLALGGVALLALVVCVVGLITSERRRVASG